jgi:ABC-2 type transport system ATP-binding protein
MAGREPVVFEAKALTKRYSGLVAVDKVSFEIHPGEILGYLGPNGSGKSSTINMVVGLVEASDGSVYLDGVNVAADPIAYKRRIGYVPEEPDLYTHLTAVEYLRLVGRLRGLPNVHLEDRILALLRLFSLIDSRYGAMSTFSKGMRQRVLLAAALMHNPDLLVLDEPFSGLDASAALLFQTLLHLLAREGKMILFSSHRFDVVEKVCSRVVILHNGRKVAEGTISELRESGLAASLEEVFAEVTRQEDYAEVAQQILRVMRDI